jgi:hypothetical protein
MSAHTRIDNVESDTVCLRFVAGQTVQMSAGAMRGLVGTVVDHRTIGRILVQIDAGICVEIHQYCVDAMPDSS